MTLYDDSLKFHEKLRGKIAIVSKATVRNKDDLILSYTPGVAAPVEEIAKDPGKAYLYTFKHNSLAVITDGSAVLGLGNVGALAALPVMEGKALLMKEFADIDAFPICLDTNDTEEIIRTIRCIAPVFGGINLEDIAAPRCFEVEERLQDLGIPVMHDDQHCTAVVVLAGLINAAKVAGKQMESLRVVIAGAGAAGTAVAKLLLCVNLDPGICRPVKEIIVCDSKGILSRNRTGLNKTKQELARITNPAGRQGTLADAMKGADVFIGVSRPNIVTKDMVRSMNKDPVIFAMCNPYPEIMPEEAKAAGARVVATGRSDFPNQVNNVVAFPGIFRGALNARARQITPKMCVHAAHAIAASIPCPTADHIIPDAVNKSMVNVVAKAVAAAAER